VPKMSINFEEIISRINGNFEEQNMVLEPSIINYCIIIIAYYSCTMNSQCNCYICIIKASSRNAIRKKMWKTPSAYVPPSMWVTMFHTHTNKNTCTAQKANNEQTQNVTLKEIPVK